MRWLLPLLWIVSGCGATSARSEDPAIEGGAGDDSEGGAETPEADLAPDVSGGDLGAPAAEGGAGQDEPQPPVDGGDEAAPELPTDVAPSPPALTLATWNLRNFSGEGPRDPRVDALAETVLGLDADIVGLQEIKVEEGTGGAGRQAWHALLDQLPGYEGARVQWDEFDTVVGVVWRSETVRLLSWEAVLGANRHAFPRTPLEARFRAGRGAGGISLTVLVLHLKAFGDSLDRRVAACRQLRDYVAGRPDKRYVLLGDFNDSPFDPEASNAFVDTLLGQEPTWRFVTAELPLGSVSSTGYFHYVGDQRHRGEFLDHVVVHETLGQAYSDMVPDILDVPSWEYDRWDEERSDHFPVVVDLVP